MEEIEIETSVVAFVPDRPSMGVSTALPAKDAKFLRVEPAWDGGWHPTPVEQYLSVLVGSFEIATSDGKSRQFDIGDIVLLADTAGKGHYTKILGDREAWILAVALG